MRGCGEGVVDYSSSLALVFAHWLGIIIIWVCGGGGGGGFGILWGESGEEVAVEEVESWEEEGGEEGVEG